MHTKIKEKSKRSKYYEHFEHIDETPDTLARIILNSPPKKKSEWRYLNKLDEKKSK